YSDWQRREIGPRQMKVNFMPRLGQLDTGTLIIHGAADKLVPVKIAKEAAQRIPNARLHVLDGCGHWSPRERPAEVNAAVREFLSP
ncbi:MAG: alpha/beta hydrolase, partial [Actinomycetia bacterium]|nr:alpha/beta hydrolase [Actinomycetes bacterium]